MCTSHLHETNYLQLRFQSFPGGSVVKNLPTNAGDTGSIPGSERIPGEGNGNSLYYLISKSHRLMSLADYSP